MTPKKRAAYMWAKVEADPSAMVSWYLMTSWLYYQQDICLLPDEDYNKLCVRLLEALPGITHKHKHLVDEDSLRAGTGYAIVAYPGIAVGAASRLAAEDKHLKWNKRRMTWEVRA